MKNIELESATGERIVKNGDVEFVFSVKGKDKNLEPYPHLTTRFAGRTIDCFNFDNSQLDVIGLAFARISKMWFPSAKINAIKNLRYEI